MVEVCRVAASEAIVASSHDTALRDEFLRWDMAFPVAVKNYLRGEQGRAGELLGVLSPADVEALLAAKQQPLYCLHMMRVAARLMASTSPQDPMLSSSQNANIGVSLATLTGAMSAMERINSTPLPFAYAAHVRAFLLVYLVFVIAVLQPACGWLTVPAVALVSFALLGTETAATECERPFKRRPDHLPLERYCLVIADNVAQLLAADADAAGRRRRGHDAGGGAGLAGRA